MHNLHIVWLYAFQFITCEIVFFYLVLLSLHRIGKFLAYVAALFVAKFWGFSIRGPVVSGWDSNLLVRRFESDT